VAAEKNHAPDGIVVTFPANAVNFIVAKEADSSPAPSTFVQKISKKDFSKDMNWNMLQLCILS